MKNFTVMLAILFMISCLAGAERELPISITTGDKLNQDGATLKVIVEDLGFFSFLKPKAKIINIGTEKLEEIRWSIEACTTFPPYKEHTYGTIPSLDVREETIISSNQSFIALFGPVEIQFIVGYGFGRCPVVKTVKLFALVPLAFGGEVEYPEMCFDADLKKINNTWEAYIVVTYVANEGEIYYNRDESTPNITLIDEFNGTAYYIDATLNLTTKKENLYTEPIRVGDRIKVHPYPPMIMIWLPTNAVITKLEWFY